MDGWLEDRRLRVQSLWAAETLSRTRKRGLHGAFNYISHLQSDQSSACSQKYEIKLYFQRQGRKTTYLEFICDHLYSANCFPWVIFGGGFFVINSALFPNPWGRLGGILCWWLKCWSLKKIMTLFIRKIKAGWIKISYLFIFY